MVGRGRVGRGLGLKSTAFVKMECAWHTWGEHQAITPSQGPLVVGYGMYTDGPGPGVGVCALQYNVICDRTMRALLPHCARSANFGYTWGPSR